MAQPRRRRARGDAPLRRRGGGVRLGRASASAPSSSGRPRARGPRRCPWPYGYRYDPRACNSAKVYRPVSEARLASGDAAVRDGGDGARLARRALGVVPRLQERLRGLRSHRQRGGVGADLATRVAVPVGAQGRLLVQALGRVPRHQRVATGRSSASTRWGSAAARSRSRGRERSGRAGKSREGERR